MKSSSALSSSQRSLWTPCDAAATLFNRRHWQITTLPSSSKTAASFVDATIASRHNLNATSGFGG
jgi:hypothetical protein